MNDVLLPDRPGPVISDEQLQWREAIRVVSRHWMVFGLVMMGGLAATGAMILSEPPVYEATARLIVQPNVAHEPFSPRDNSSSLMARYADSRGAEAEINASLAMLESRALVRKVLETAASKGSRSRRKSEPGLVSRVIEDIRELPAKWYQEIHTPPEVDPMDRRVNGSLKALGVRALEDSNVIEVTYKSGDPEWAASFVNALVNEYLSPDGVLQQGSDRFSFFHEQRALVEQRLEAARAALRAFRDQDESDLAFEDGSELRSLRAQLQGRKDEMSAELAGVDARLSSLAQEMRGLPSSVNIDPQLENIEAVDRVAARVTELELERSELLSRYAPTSAVVRDIDVQLDRAKHMLANEVAAADTAIAKSGTAAQELALERVQVRIQRSLLTGTLTALSAEIDVYTSKLDKFDKLSTHRELLENELALAEEAYTTYRRKEEEARFTEALRRAGIRNQMVIERAEVPSVPEPAGAGRMLVFGLVLSTLAAMGIVRMLDRLDSSVKAVAEAEYFSGANVIGLVTLDEAPEVEEPDAKRGLRNFLQHPTKSIAAFSVLAVLLGLYVQSVTRSAVTEGSRSSALAEVTRVPEKQSSVRRVASSGGSDVGRTQRVRREAPPAEPIVPIAEPFPVLEAALAVEAQPVAAAVPVEPAEAEPQYMAVEIEQGTTMYSLLRRVYGAYTPDHLERVRLANPWLEDPTRILAGTLLYLPLDPGAEIPATAGRVH